MTHLISSYELPAGFKLANKKDVIQQRTNEKFTSLKLDTPNAGILLDIMEWVPLAKKICYLVIKYIAKSEVNNALAKKRLELISTSGVIRTKIDNILKHPHELAQQSIEVDDANSTNRYILEKLKKDDEFTNYFNPKKHSFVVCASAYRPSLQNSELSAKEIWRKFKRSHLNKWEKLKELQYGMINTDNIRPDEVTRLTLEQIGVMAKEVNTVKLRKEFCNIDWNLQAITAIEKDKGKLKGEKEALEACENRVASASNFLKVSLTKEKLTAKYVEAYNLKTAAKNGSAAISIEDSDSPASKSSPGSDSEISYSHSSSERSMPLIQLSKTALNNGSPDLKIDGILVRDSINGLRSFSLNGKEHDGIMINAQVAHNQLKSTLFEDTTAEAALTGYLLPLMEIANNDENMATKEEVWKKIQYTLSQDHETAITGCIYETIMEKDILANKKNYLEQILQSNDSTPGKRVYTYDEKSNTLTLKTTTEITYKRGSDKPLKTFIEANVEMQFDFNNDTVTCTSLTTKAKKKA